MSEQYQNYTYQSPFALKRWLHQKRFTDAVKFLKLKENETVLDYGCGDGHFLEVAVESHPKELIFGYEPAQDLFDQAKEKLDPRGIAVHKNLDALQSKKFDKIICMETCEHLPKKELQELLSNIKSLLKENGQLVISVPIESGLPALAKNSFRFIKDRHYDNLTIGNYFRTFLGRPVQRRADQALSGLNYIFSHIGFNFKEFEKELVKQFKIKKRYGSPTPGLHWSLNNTLYYVCEI